MKIPRAPHSWTVSPKAAVAIQRRLATRVRFQAPAGPTRLVVGVDCAFTAERCIAAATLWDVADKRILEQTAAWRPLRFPYIPGLLSFREAPAVLAALKKLRRAPDAVMIDGHGYGHPRRFGLACHVGVILDRPAVGCGKSRLLGSHGDPPARRGGRAPLVDKGERIGTVLRTEKHLNPVYVTVGHRMSLESAEALVLACAIGHRLPEPTRLADIAVAVEKRRTVGSAPRRGTRSRAMG